MNSETRRKFHILPEITGDMFFSSSDIKKLLVPIIAETLLSYLIGLADSVMVASAGESAVSAVSLVDSVSILFINLFAGLATGGAVVCGQYLGKNDKLLAKSAAVQLVVIMAVLSVSVSALLLTFKFEVIDILFGSAEKAVTDNCSIYYGIVMYSVPFIALYNAGAALFRTVGDSKTPLLISLGMNFLNVAGNALLIYGFKMGVAGAAIPTLISRCVAMVVVLALASRKSFVLSIFKISRFKFSSKLVSDILSIGMPNSIENGMFQFGKLILMSLASTRPTSEITANAIGNSVASLHCVIGMSANLAMTAVVSRCAGAHDFSQARKYVRYFLTFTYITEGIANIFLALGIPVILKLYGVEGYTAKIATEVLLIHGISSIVIWPYAFMLNTAMRAAGDSRYAMIISSISMWLCRVLLAHIFIKIFGMSVTGIWIAWIIDWIFRITFFLPRYKSGIWEKKAVV